MREAILRALERSRANYTEIRVEREWRTEVAYRKENLENLEASSELGGHAEERPAVHLAEA